ncbi:MAG: hypothetical protein EP330_15595 [Deltaproteobacteria bacterium]|nr:MAG: hypothetical protein EP330_15595 [Deltaproteobacteria bacterium]
MRAWILAVGLVVASPSMGQECQPSGTRGPVRLLSCGEHELGLLEILGEEQAPPAELLAMGLAAITPPDRKRKKPKEVPVAGGRTAIVWPLKGGGVVARLVDGGNARFVSCTDKGCADLAGQLIATGLPTPRPTFLHEEVPVPAGCEPLENGYGCGEDALVWADGAPLPIPEPDEFAALSLHPLRSALGVAPDSGVLITWSCTLAGHAGSCIRLDVDTPRGPITVWSTAVEGHRDGSMLTCITPDTGPSMPDTCRPMFAEAVDAQGRAPAPEPVDDAPSEE